MHQLAPIDLAIVAVYILGMTVLGIWFTRSQKDLRTYFVGGRSIGWFMVLISIVATETSAVTFLSVPGVGYDPKTGNLTFLQLAFGVRIHAPAAGMRRKQVLELGIEALQPGAL